MHPNAFLAAPPSSSPRLAISASAPCPLPQTRVMVRLWRPAPSTGSRRGITLAIYSHDPPVRGWRLWVLVAWPLLGQGMFDCEGNDAYGPSFTCSCSCHTLHIHTHKKTGGRRADPKDPQRIYLSHSSALLSSPGSGIIYSLLLSKQQDLLIPRDQAAAPL